MMKLHRERRGQALVEFALAVPIFFLLLFGLIDLGRAIYVDNAMAQASREASRWGSVQARSFDSSSWPQIADYARERMTAVPDAEITIDCIKQVANTPHCRINDILIVEISTELEMITPVVGQIIGTLELRSVSRVAVNN